MGQGRQHAVRPWCVRGRVSRRASQRGWRSPPRRRPRAWPCSQSHPSRAKKERLDGNSDARDDVVDEDEQCEKKQRAHLQRRDRAFDVCGGTEQGRSQHGEQVHLLPQSELVCHCGTPVQNAEGTGVKGRCTTAGLVCVRGGGFRRSGNGDRGDHVWGSMVHNGTLTLCENGSVTTKYRTPPLFQLQPTYNSPTLLSSQLRNEMTLLILQWVLLEYHGGAFYVAGN